MKGLTKVLLGLSIIGSSAADSTPCKWSSKVGANYNLQPLTKTDSAYLITDGDIPCTPETEPSFHYIWNFCADVPKSLIPDECSASGKKGVVLQYANYGDGNKYCYIIGHYDSSQYEINYSLLDVEDPTKGVSISYPAGERCSDYGTGLRKASIDVLCANTPSAILSAQEPTRCEYHLTMKSYYGCPTECPVTSNGLCSSHGICAYDSKAKKPYCYCNTGFYGSDCSSTTDPDAAGATYDGFSVQLGLLITLLIVAMGLTGGMVYLSMKIGEFRKQQVSSHYKTLPGGENEMVETVSFR